MQLGRNGQEMRSSNSLGFKLDQNYDLIGQSTKQQAGFDITSLGAGLDGAIEAQKRGAYYEEPKKVDFVSSDGKQIVGETYLWAADVIAEVAPLLANGQGDCENATKWHYEPDTFRPIAKETPNGELFYIVNDHLGTPREMFSDRQASLFGRHNIAHFGSLGALSIKSGRRIMIMIFAAHTHHQYAAI